ncbi:unnamed protein product, partial [Pocillopora meandrina]
IWHLSSILRAALAAQNYKKQKNFVKEVAKTFGLSPNGSRAAMVLYSNSASVKARFGQYTDPKEFDGAVDSLPYERGLTRIDKALELTASDIFAQSRSGVPKIAMLITDGTQTAAADAKGLKRGFRTIETGRCSCSSRRCWQGCGQRRTSTGHGE